MKRLSLLAMVLAVVLTGTSAWADFYVVASGGPPVGTKITSLPYTISNSGFYFLGKDLSTTGSGITVNTDNVTIDLMGFNMAGNDTAGHYGIIISGRNNVEIRNGTVRDFDGGIYSVTYAQSCRIINIRAISNVGSGIKLVGDNHLVRNCHASNNSGSGIWQSGSGAMITGAAYSASEGLDHGRMQVDIDCPARKRGEPITVRVHYQVPIYLPFVEKLFPSDITVSGASTMRIENDREK